MSDPELPITRLLSEWQAGSDAAFGRLSALLHDELRVLAQRQLRQERPGHTVPRTALVNEVFLRLVAQRSVDWQNRAQFFAVASSLMRRILVEHARTRRQREPVPDEEVVAIDAALEELAGLDPQQAKVVEMRYFAGLTDEETADALGLPTATVKREWAMARAWLRCELAPTS